AMHERVVPCLTRRGYHARARRRRLTAGRARLYVGRLFADLMSRKNVEDIYPLSPLQQGILFHTLAAPTSGVYVVQRSWAIDGAIDAGALARAFQAVVDRHPILRTAFVWDRHGRPMQVVRERAALPFEAIDLRGVPAEEQAARARAFAEADPTRGFETSR